MSASEWKVYISTLSVSGCGPRCISPVTANPTGLSQSISTEPQSSGALPLQFSLTGQHANPLTQGRLDGVEGVTRAEVNGTNLGRWPQCSLVRYSRGPAGRWRLGPHAVQTLQSFGVLQVQGLHQNSMSCTHHFQCLLHETVWEQEIVCFGGLVTSVVTFFGDTFSVFIIRISATLKATCVVWTGRQK